MTKPPEVTEANNELLDLLGEMADALADSDDEGLKATIAEGIRLAEELAEAD